MVRVGDSYKGMYRPFLVGQGGGCFHKNVPICGREGLLTRIKFLFTNRWAEGYIDD